MKSHPFPRHPNVAWHRPMLAFAVTQGCLHSPFSLWPWLPSPQASSCPLCPHPAARVPLPPLLGCCCPHTPQCRQIGSQVNPYSSS